MHAVAPALVVVGLESIDGDERRDIAGLGDAVGGAWVQAYYLWLIVKGVGGQLAAESGEDKVTLAAVVPAG